MHDTVICGWGEQVGETIFFIDSVSFRFDSFLGEKGNIPVNRKRLPGDRLLALGLGWKDGFFFFFFFWPSRQQKKVFIPSPVQANKIKTNRSSQLLRVLYDGLARILRMSRSGTPWRGRKRVYVVPGYGIRSEIVRE